MVITQPNIMPVNKKKHLLTNELVNELINYRLIRLEDNGVVTDCSLKTLEPEDTLDFNFNSANVVSKVIIKV